MPTSSLRFDEPFITLACPRCKTARARPAPIKTPGYGVAFAQAFVTALDGGRAKAGDTARVVLTAAFSEDGLSGDYIEFSGLDGPGSDGGLVADVAPSTVTLHWYASRKIVRMTLGGRVAKKAPIEAVIETDLKAVSYTHLTLPTICSV